jgi:glutamate-1-semialdehyde 2,1-aminomutase
MADPTTSRQSTVTTRSQQLHAAAVKVLPGGTSRTVHQTHPHPIYAREASGAVVVDVDGNRYLDFYNNATSLIHGHAHPAIVSAIEAQVRRGTAFSLPVEGQITLAETLLDRIAGAEMIRFVNSGSEAVLLALQAARAISGRPNIAKFEGLYHGSADPVEMSLEPGPESWGSPTAPTSVPYTEATPKALAESVVVLPFNDLATTEELLRAHADTLAAVIVDVLPMRLGFAAADQSWVTEVRRITRDHGILLIADEVVTFRLAFGGAQAINGFDADVTVLGKIIGGGLPVGALAGPRDVMRAFDGSRGRPSVPNAGTFNANPLTLAAGIAAMDALPAAEIERVNELGLALRQSIDTSLDKLGVPGHTTGFGSLFGVHLTAQRFSDYRGYWHACVGDHVVKRRQQRLYDSLRERGILFTTGGVGALSTVMSASETGAFHAAFVDAVEEMQREGLWSS